MANTERSDKTSEIGVISHVVLRVADLDQMVRFCADALGLRAEKVGAKWVEFRSGATVIAVQKLSRADPRQECESPVEITFEVADAAATLVRLCAFGALTTQPLAEICSEQGGSYLYAAVIGPESHRFGVYQRRPVRVGPDR